MRTQKAYVILAVLLYTSTGYGIRHSAIKRSERIELRKQKVATKDQSIRAILNKQTKNMSFAEAQRAKEYYSKEHDAEMIIKCGQRLLTVGGDQEVMRITRLDLAEIFLDKKNYVEAEKYAQEYQKYYPGAHEIKKAEHIAIQANFRSKLPSDRDQEKTRTTIKLAQEFLEKHPQDKEYSQSIQQMTLDCYQTLIRNEINIINSQLRTYNYTKKRMVLTAAQKRLAYIKEQYLPHAPATEKRLHELEQRLAHLADPGSTQSQPQQPLILAQKGRAASRRNSLYHIVKRHVNEDNEEYFA